LRTKSLYWNDDKEVVDTFVLKTIKRFDPKNKAIRNFFRSIRMKRTKSLPASSSVPLFSMPMSISAT
jgi:hypothetical protein